jgi:hypothetical protein
MAKPRLVVRLAVALIAFIIGITSTLLFNYFWPGSRLSQPAVRRVFITTEPHAFAPCGRYTVTVQPAFEWTPVAPPAPPAPPEPPQPPARMHVSHSSK